MTRTGANWSSYATGGNSEAGWRCSEGHRVVARVRPALRHRPWQGPHIESRDARNSLLWTVGQLTEPILEWLGGHPNDPGERARETNLAGTMNEGKIGAVLQRDARPRSTKCGMRWSRCASGRIRCTDVFGGNDVRRLRWFSDLPSENGSVLVEQRESSSGAEHHA